MVSFFPGPMSAIPPHMKPEINDYSDDSSHTSYSVKISNTCVMTDNSRFLDNSLSNGDLESSREMHDKDNVIYGNFSLCYRIGSRTVQCKISIYLIVL